MNTQDTALTDHQQLLKDAGLEFCRLRVDKEAFEIRLGELDKGDTLGAAQIRNELDAITERMIAAQLEQAIQHAAILREQLPHAREAVAPLKEALEKANGEYRRAYDNREAAAIAHYMAELKVGNTERNIEDYDNLAERLRLEIGAKQGSPTKLASEIASEITGLESRLQVLRTMTPQPVTETGLIG